MKSDFKALLGNSLIVQWLGLSAFAARTGFNPWWGNKTLKSFMAEPKKKKTKAFLKKDRDWGWVNARTFFSQGEKQM